jgi:regulation of enolase protein 1 (concanavalin A-like superfamily)
MYPNHVSRLLLLAVILATTSAGLEANDKIVKGFGQVTDPDGDCKIEQGAKGSISITVPAVPHDLSYSGTNSGQNAPRVLREVEGDFIVRVKVVGKFEPGDTPAVEGKPIFQGAGLLLWISDNHFIRLERNIMRSGDTKYCFAPLLEQWKNRKFVGKTAPVEDSTFFKGNSTYLQLERISNEVTASISHDGSEWIANEPIKVKLPQKVSIGVAAINTANQPFKVQVDDYRLFVRKGDRAEEVE